MAAIHIIGLGTELHPLSASANQALEQAGLIIGGQRHLDALAPTQTATQPYPSPFSDLLPLLEENADKRLVLLASGDPLFFGIGGYLRQQLPQQELVFHPNVSSMQTACARLGMDWQNADFLSLHGRPLNRLRARLRNGQRLVILTDTSNSPDQIGRTLLDCQYETSRVNVMEALDTDRERIRCFSPDQLAACSAEDFDPLNVLIADISGKGGLLPDFPGMDDAQLLPDAKGRRMFTKRQIRLNALSLLQTRAGNIAWDIGAGCGGLALEWARWHPGCEIHAIEQSRIRLDCLHTNQQRFGDHGNLHILLGAAPEALADLPDPDRIFVGGNAGKLPEILKYCWSRLRKNGRIVAVAVTLESRTQLISFATAKDAHWEEINISETATLGDQTALKPRLPVLMMQVSKP